MVEIFGLDYGNGCDSMNNLSAMCRVVCADSLKYLEQIRSFILSTNLD